MRDSKLSKFCIFLYLCLETQFQIVSSAFKTSPSFSAQVIASNIPTPRGLIIDEFGDILVLSRGLSSIVALFLVTENSEVFSQVVVLNGTSFGLNHGLAYNKDHLYASSGSTVYRWPYTPGQRHLITAKEEVVISNISLPDEKKVNTRTLIFDAEDLLYVTINSDIRLDNDSRRCRINRFNVTILPNGGIEFDAGEVYADGLRNEVGLAFDDAGILWGVENAGGADYLIRDDLGGNIHDGNPAEELNRLNQPPGTHYGYPYCFGSYNLSGYDVGTQFAWPTAMNDGIHSDEWCRQASNNEPATLFLPPHMAPLGIDFFRGDICSGTNSETGAFPCSGKGDAIVAYHGSINISQPVGYKVVMYKFKGEGANRLPTGEFTDVIYDLDATKTFRPVSAIFNKDGHLIISDDSSNHVIKITYKGESSGSFSVTCSAQTFLFVISFWVGLKDIILY